MREEEVLACWNSQTSSSLVLNSHMFVNPTIVHTFIITHQLAGPTKM